VRPALSEPQRFFRDLIAFAPGMNTIHADIAAVLEAEAAINRPAAGRIDPEARKLIDAARSGGFRRVVVKDDNGVSFPVICDGMGSFIIERTLPIGLKEKICCDGDHLWHLYPELGI